jgi:hypothetical protein
MLFYVLLFAINQNVHRQKAWAKSFGMWLLSEIVLVSSVAVLVMNVWIPSLIMRDVQQMRQKLLENYLHHDLKEGKEWLGMSNHSRWRQQKE